MTADHRLERARRLLSFPSGWIDGCGDGYVIRTGRDRRARIMLRLDETDFVALTREPGLRPRGGGGWTARPTDRLPAPPPPGRPGVVEGVRPVMQPDGAIVERPANLAASPVAWLASRRDPNGRPLLSKAEAVAADRLCLEAEAARRGPNLTMSWDAPPRSGKGRSRPGAPMDSALLAAGRIEAALRACGPGRTMVELVCLNGFSLQAAERRLGLRRRTGKAILRLGLGALARHYRLGQATDIAGSYVTGS
ncbi:DUF6456 domain-containing protein [Brevundimonas sp. FT23028]|uniref:DUF6456 domain-containing protein n=1 Tax=Brevundimonas sp. FT23028 TaxID=3393748 RepID=UPI003B5896B1